MIAAWEISVSTKKRVKYYLLSVCRFEFEGDHFKLKATKDKKSRLLSSLNLKLPTSDYALYWTSWGNGA